MNTFDQRSTPFSISVISLVAMDWVKLVIKHRVLFDLIARSLAYSCFNFCILASIQMDSINSCEWAMPRVFLLIFTCAMINSSFLPLHVALVKCIEFLGVLGR